jgi:hypothetical protein
VPQGWMSNTTPRHYLRRCVSYVTSVICNGREPRGIAAGLHQHQQFESRFSPDTCLWFFPNLPTSACTCSGREPQDVEAALHRAVDAYQQSG